ncbi:MAG: plastocyanin/azurin family copper-binding protein [Rhodobacteraceae bacterium]|nr:plastocyanin/azurin family copper-binding protein [Paracoccaceae bacterium]
MTPRFRSPRGAFLLAAALAGTCAASAADAASDEVTTTVRVTLWDKGAAAMGEAMTGPMDMGLGMAGAGDLSAAPVGLTVDRAEFPAGEVTFAVTNASAEVIHEMIVAPLPPGVTALDYDAAEQTADEDRAGALGEVAETEPGQTGSLTLHLKPGRYLLFCNVPGHFAMGMWTIVSVTG